MRTPGRPAATHRSEALEVADRTTAGRRLAAWVADRNIRRMGNQFIAGRTPQEATDTLAQLWRGGRPPPARRLAPH